MKVIKKNFFFVTGYKNFWLKGITNKDVFCRAIYL